MKKRLSKKSRGDYSKKKLSKQPKRAKKTHYRRWGLAARLEHPRIKK